ncbi:MAG: N-6 DNA methylase, partial [Rhabdochlamydiaceae bacterium]
MSVLDHAKQDLATIYRTYRTSIVEVSPEMGKETSTIIKKILPYLNRLGYSTNEELFFEESVKDKDEKIYGFTDIEVHINGILCFLIEAKRDSQKINEKHREQVIKYGKAKNVPFVVVTNGQTFEIWNPIQAKQITVNSQTNLCPAKKDLRFIISELRKQPTATELTIRAINKSYAPGVTFRELTNVFKRCHNAIRDIEKDDEHAFSDFSKFLFLKLLEEKAEEEEFDPDGFDLPYTQRFASIKDQPDDEIEASIHLMFTTIQKDRKYGEVLEDDTFHIQNSKTYGKIVKELATVYFGDSDVDVKGSAFEYFLKFNLKGSQLGQYFTPREVVRLMIELSNLKASVIGLINPDQKCVVIDPACGSGGFLITGMQTMIN